MPKVIITRSHPVPDSIRHHRSWHTSSNVHTINVDDFPKAVEGDTCMIGFRLYLCTGPRGEYSDGNGQWWIFIGHWGPELGYALVRRAYRIDTGTSSWRWKDAEFRGYGIGFMQEIANAP